MASLFLSEGEREAIAGLRREGSANRIYWAQHNRAGRLAETPGLAGREGTCQWWHVASSYLSDVAMAHALNPTEVTGAWLRDAVLGVVRRPEDDWIGPAFRQRSDPPMGHLETSHLTWGVAVALDLAGEVFSDPERKEIADVLRERGVPMCMRWLDDNTNLANWRCVLAAGVAVAAAVLDHSDWMRRAVDEFELCIQAFQEDGSYGESLQYGNYAAISLMLVYESLVRRDESLVDRLSIDSYAGYARWAAASLLYVRPMSGWGEVLRPRSANFNDSTAMHRPSGDLLLHIAARAAKQQPEKAALARWLFDTLHVPACEVGPFDGAAFGFYNHLGFLCLPLLAHAPEARSLSELGLHETEAFDVGDVLMRDRWDNGRTVVAFHGGSDMLATTGHLHGDLNSLIVAHNRQRLLVDPGHSCYRNITRNVETSSQTHNTCTFTLPGNGDLARPEDVLLAGMLGQQRGAGRRRIVDGQAGPRVRRGKRLLAMQLDNVRASVNEAADAYGKPIRTFTRAVVLIGSHALFVIDHIIADDPVRTTWNWLLNNRDGQLDLKLVQPDRLVARRGEAGMKLFHLGKSTMQGPIYAVMHDMYHPLPARQGEGRPGGGTLIRWQEPCFAEQRSVVHAVALDDPGAIAGWHLRQDGLAVALESPGGAASYRLEAEERDLHWRISTPEGTYRLNGGDGEWTLRRSEA